MRFSFCPQTVNWPLRNIDRKREPVVNQVPLCWSLKQIANFAMRPGIEWPTKSKPCHYNCQSKPWNDYYPNHAMGRLFSFALFTHLTSAVVSTGCASRIWGVHPENHCLDSHRYRAWGAKVSHCYVSNFEVAMMCALYGTYRVGYG